MKIRQTAAICAALVLSMFIATTATGQTYSKLWGKNGEKWTPTSRLPDFSFAGYHFGEDPLPKIRVTTSVKKFGAKGDGKTDDTEAFKKAIEATKEGAILIPAGRYILKDILWIKKSNIVLRGEGANKTILHFPLALEDVRPNSSKTTSGRPTSGYSWSGGFLWMKGGTSAKPLGNIISTHKRGDTKLTLDKKVDVKVGQRVQVQMRDTTKKSLLSHLYSGDPGDVKKIIRPIRVSLVSRVAAVSGKTVTLERPLRWDIHKEWAPVLKTFTPAVSEVGIEELGITFPVKPYKGHFTERGMNGIAMNGVSDCWIRNVRISNCDSGVFVGGTFCTVDGLIIDGKRKASRGDTGHHGITLGQDCLVQNFDVQAKFIHDITFSNRQAGNVVKNGKGRSLSFDHHKRAPYENLVCNVDVGDGGQVWRCGGGKSLGKNCGARGTFWCIRAKKNMRAPSKGFGPASLNVVGLKSNGKSQTDPKGRWFEAIPPEQLQPADLHAAQLARRLTKQK